MPLRALIVSFSALATDGPQGRDANGALRGARRLLSRRPGGATRGGRTRVRLEQEAESSRLEIFGPEDRDHEIFDTGPVPEFLVDDVHAAAAELRAAGVHLLDEVEGPAEEGWVHFRAPDGNVYGLCSSPSYRR